MPTIRMDFRREHPTKKGYSATEYDLAGGKYSIRRNLKTNEWEIFNIKTGEVQYRYPKAKDIIRVAREMGDTFASEIALEEGD